MTAPCRLRSAWRATCRVSAMCSTVRAPAIKLYGLRVIDLRDAKSADALNHSKFRDDRRRCARSPNDTMVARGNPISRTACSASRPAPSWRRLARP